MANKQNNHNRYNKRELVLLADGGRCANCGAEENLDLVIMSKSVGSPRLRDVVTLCRSCNKRKAYNFIIADMLEVEREKRLREKGIEYGEVQEEYEREGKVQGRERFFGTDS